MAGIDKLHRYGVICNSEEKELCGKAISALRRLGKNVDESRVIALLVAEYGCTEEEAKHALDICEETEQAVSESDIWNLDDYIIQKYGYLEHQIQRPKNQQSAPKKPVEKKITMLRRVVKPKTAKAEPVISVQDDIKILKQILEGQPGKTMVKSHCETALRSRGVRQQRLVRLFREIEAESLVIYGRDEKHTPTITWAESTSSREIPEDYSVIKRFSG